MTITIEMTPELEYQLQQAAAQAGLTPDAYIVQALRERLTPPRPSSAQMQRLTAAEARLLMRINQSLAGIAWPRYHALIAKRQAETLTSDEQQEFITLSDQIEAANVQRIEALSELARLRDTTVNTLIQNLGLKPVAHA
jgi:hypothetical protein